MKTLYSCHGVHEADGRKINAHHLSEQNNVDIKCSFESGKVVEVGNNINTNESDEVIDATGLVATPSWIDSHTHSVFSGNRAKEFFLRWKGESYQSIFAQGGGMHNTVRDTEASNTKTLAEELKLRLRQMIKSGTSVVEIKSGYSNSAESELKILRFLKSFSKENCLNKDIPEISTTFLGLHAVPPNKTEFEFTKEMISILDTVAKENLADHVDAFPEKGFFSLESSLLFARAAMEKGLLPKIHCDELSDLRSSEYFVSLGARSIDHLQKINSTGVSLLAQSHTVATLMPATSFYLGLEYANARKLIDAGACVALATDYNPGTAPCYQMSFTQTLAAKELKMSPPEILASSTYCAAKALGKDKTHGTITKNKFANINLYKASSLEELFYTWTEPEMVVHKSQKVKI